MVRMIGFQPGDSLSSDNSATMHRNRRSKSSHHRRIMSSLIQPSGATASRPEPAPERTISSKTSHGRREIARGEQAQHRRSKSLPQFRYSRKVNSGSKALIQKGIHDSPGEDSGNETTFYARVTLGHLTGIKISSKKKAYKNVNEIVGYAALASTGTQIAISEPLNHNAATKSSQRLSNLIWLEPDDDKATKRTSLHFSLQLQKEIQEGMNSGEDEPVRSNMSYAPKVVKLVIGLKCGDEKLPLGIVSLVMDGKKEMNQKVVLAVRPVDDATDKRYRLTKLFGNKVKGKSFSESCSYSLSSNAVLRVNLATKSGVAGQTKNQVWGDGFGLESSKLTRESSKDISEPSKAVSEPVKTSTGDFTMTREHEIALPYFHETKLAPEIMLPSSHSRRVLPSSHNRRVRNMSMNSVPHTVVTVNDDDTITSDISSRRTYFLSEDCFMDSLGMQAYMPANLCGNRNQILEEEAKELILIEDNHNDDVAKNTIARSNNSIREGSEAEGGRKNFSVAATEQSRMTTASYEDLKKAQETLRSYALRAGVDIEEILDRAEASKAANNAE